MGPVWVGTAAAGGSECSAADDGSDAPRDVVPDVGWCVRLAQHAGVGLLLRGLGGSTFDRDIVRGAAPPAAAAAGHSHEELAVVPGW
jgi:hypothetical protein